jgi:hypothetical protein
MPGVHTTGQGVPTGTSRSLNGLGVASLVLGFFGLVFFWLVPLGIILSAAGIPLGIAGWVAARRRLRGGLGFALGGTVLSILALIISIDLASGGLTRLLLSNRY